MFTLSISKFNDVHVLWFIADRSYFGRHWRETIRKWAEWVESHEFKGTTERCYGGEWHSLENKMIFTDLSDALMIKLAFNSAQFE